MTTFQELRQVVSDHVDDIARHEDRIVVLDRDVRSLAARLYRVERDHSTSDYADGTDAVDVDRTFDDQGRPQNLEADVVERELVESLRLEHVPTDEHPEPLEAPDSDETEQDVGSSLPAGIEEAWGVIGNAYGGDWVHAPREWVQAARRWRNEHISREQRAEEQDVAIAKRDLEEERGTVVPLESQVASLRESLERIASLNSPTAESPTSLFGRAVHIAEVELRRPRSG